MKISTTLLLLSLRSATVVAFDAAKGHVSPPILADCLELDKNQPLYQPPVITSDEAEWTFDLVVEEGQVGDLLPCGIRYKSRLYNGNVPGPTVRTRRGQTVNISLVNTLGPEDPTVVPVANHFHTPNTTNLHIHFIHASPGLNEDGTSQDDVLLHVDPGTTQRYHFPLHSDHASGTGWYHPHYHGSVDFQLYNGMAGAWIMEDEEDKEYAETPQLKDMVENILVMQSIDMAHHAGRMGMDNADLGNQDYQFWKEGGGPHSNMNVDFENPFGLDIRLLLTNGQYNPLLEMQQGSVHRLRMINAITSDSLHFVLHGANGMDGEAGTADDPCEMWEIAKDSIYLPEPVRVDTIFVAAGSRVDFALSCPGLEVGQTVELVSDHTDTRFEVSTPDPNSNATYGLGYIWSTKHFVPKDEQNNQAFLTVKLVEGADDDLSVASSQSGMDTMEFALPSYPSYLQKLVDESAATPQLDPDTIKELSFSGPATVYEQPEAYFAGDIRMEFRDVNGMMFDMDERLWTVAVGELDEWHLTNIDDPTEDEHNTDIFSHHFHFHTNHYLMMQDDPETGGLLFREGEIRDTIPFYPTKFGDYDRPPIRIRVLYMDYDGTNIVHCHQADHSDEGMAALFDMVFPNDVAVADGPTPADETTDEDTPGEVEEVNIFPDDVAVADGPPPADETTDEETPEEVEEVNIEGANTDGPAPADEATNEEAPDESEMKEQDEDAATVSSISAAVILVGAAVLMA